MPFSQRKSIKGSVRQRLGDIICQFNLKEDELLEPGTTMPVNVMIKVVPGKHHSVKFDEIRVRLKETHSWNSIINSKAGNDNFLTETKVLAREQLTCWEDHIDEDDPTNRTVELNDVELEIPEDAVPDREYGLVRVHHFLDIKLVSKGGLVDNLKFKFPVVIGGDQYDLMPSNHPMNFKNQDSVDKIMARGIANTVMAVTNTAEHLWLERGGGGGGQSAAKKMAEQTTE